MELIDPAFVLALSQCAFSHQPLSESPSPNLLHILSFAQPAGHTKAERRRRLDNLALYDLQVGAAYDPKNLTKMDTSVLSDSPLDNIHALYNLYMNLEFALRACLDRSTMFPSVHKQPVIFAILECICKLIRTSDCHSWYTTLSATYDERIVTRFLFQQTAALFLPIFRAARSAQSSTPGGVLDAPKTKQIYETALSLAVRTCSDLQVVFCQGATPHALTSLIHQLDRKRQADPSPGNKKKNQRNDSNAARPNNTNTNNTNNNTPAQNQGACIQVVRLDGSNWPSQGSFPKPLPQISISSKRLCMDYLLRGRTCNNGPDCPRFHLLSEDQVPNGARAKWTQWITDRGLKVIPGDCPPAST